MQDQQNSEEPIEILGPTDMLRKDDGALRQSIGEVDGLVTPEVTEAMKSITTIDSCNYRIKELPARFVHLRPTLDRLIELQKSQFDIARDMVVDVINFHSNKKNLRDPQCVYWAAGLDKFAEGFPGWWKFVGIYDERMLEEARKYGWSVLEQGNVPSIRLIGQPTVLSYDVTQELPDELADDSLDVSLLKTPGSIFSHDPGIEEKFWERIIRTTKRDGLIITTNDPPHEWRSSLQPYRALLPIIGKTTIELNAPVAASSLRGGYFAREFYFMTPETKP